MVKQKPNSGRFTKINESFRCEHCHKNVPIAAQTCRNHCPHCLYSKHVDLFPGDRQNTCQGLLEPIGYELSGKKGVILRFRCQRCRAEVRNKALLNDRIQSDDYQQILALTQ